MRKPPTTSDSIFANGNRRNAETTLPTETLTTIQEFINGASEVVILFPFRPSIKRKDVTCSITSNALTLNVAIP